MQKCSGVELEEAHETFNICQSAECRFKTQGHGSSPLLSSCNILLHCQILSMGLEYLFILF